MSIEREHAPYHERRLEQQTLDVLLRIEEQLFAIGKALTERTVITGPEAAAEPEDKGNYEDRHTPDTTKPKGKRK